MYRSSFFGLNSALSGVLASQMALDTTAHNITNAGTDGYQRQRAELVAAPQYTVPGFNQNSPSQIGTGVNVSAIVALRDRIAERNLTNAIGEQSEAETMLAQLSQLEDILAEPGPNGLSGAMSRFFNALDDVASQPDDIAVRQVLLDSANQLAARFNQVGSAIAQVDADADQRLNDIVTEVNTLTTQIAQLNTQIRIAKLSGSEPNWEVAERTRLMNELGERINFTSSYSPTDDWVTITFQGAAPTTIVNSFVPGGTTPIVRADLDAMNFSGGEAFALEQLRANVLAPATPGSLVNNLDALVNSIVTGINAQHLAGFDLNGATGVNSLFNPLGTTMQTMGMAITDPRLIAAADTWAAPGEPGDGDNILAMLGLRDATQGAPLNDSWEGYYRTQIGSLGSSAQASQRNMDNAAALTMSMRDRVDQASGVNLDEEMSNLLRFQHAYNASARVLSTLDEMLDVLINRTGRVGL